MAQSMSRRANCWDIEVTRYQQLTNSEKFSKWLFPMHNGEIIGFPGKLLVMLTGLMTLIITLSAFVYWHTGRTKFNKAKKDLK